MRLLVSDLTALMAADAILLLDAETPAPRTPLALWRVVPSGADWLLRPESGVSRPGAGTAENRTGSAQAGPDQTPASLEWGQPRPDRALGAMDRTEAGADDPQASAAPSYPGTAYAQPGMVHAQAGTAHTQAGTAMPAAPAGVLGVLATAPPPWLAAWPDEPPPVFADQAALAEALAGRMLTGRRRNAALRDALVALRLEHEDSRLAMARWMRGAGQGWPQAPRLEHADTPAGGCALPAGRTRLRRILALEVGNVSALALHLAAAECGPGSALRLRLLGLESRIVLGAWVVPGEALRAGWLALDLAVPAAPRRETAAVEIDIDLAPGDRLTLDAPPALRVSKTEGMARFVQALHWDGLSHGLALPPDGAWLGLPAHVWEGVPRRLVLAPGETRALRLPALPVSGLDTLLARLRLLGGTAMQAEMHGPGGGTGWRDFSPDGVLEMALAVPVGGPAVQPLTLGLRQLGPHACGVEWQELAGMRAV